MLRKNSTVPIKLNMFATLFLIAGILYLAVPIIQFNEVLANTTILLFIVLFSIGIILMFIMVIYKNIKIILKYIKNILLGF
ncbi:MAG: hypothetical protein FFODKBPE_00568 [Candidatus Argoarchaeum ethanivorans]|uniref:Uncharacterized protein n=1 Tax=Candidatus Argoarchaeum ethanivorans TaxID=2608793 RepID=A0A811T8P4_9EURY|nr:MAG: hypothetical protein FFODKBPE_00568 [Candidatus Argoarchaeum ethanivorans]